eukprot:CAMPEP_0194413730 /NCGR_PEP_ID=MMETSP0176-20130528/12323_1 /TAXON_ID=216777 /ORGANISM="Proboscia alata, Strain PI-D3" /LENGTH=114 /DNA_ID=CAMNT_0039217289 /DNA_START=233 /DNA_END=577 /DNA_ORIENTATION=-
MVTGPVSRIFGRGHLIQTEGHRSQTNCQSQKNAAAQLFGVCGDGRYRERKRERQRSEYAPGGNAPVISAERAFDRYIAPLNYQRRSSNLWNGKGGIPYSDAGDGDGDGGPNPRL